MATEELHPGLTVGGYLLEERRGRGGFGEVWRARPVGGGAPVAIKFALDPGYVRFLKKEGVLQHTLEHPGIVRTLEVRTDCSPPYVVMEYVEGQSLRELLDEQGPLRARDAESLLFALLEVLDYTHRRGVTHRDLKPSNVLVDRATGRVKLTDFGLGQVTGRFLSDLLVSRGLVSGSAQAVAGTFAYQAPEAWCGREVDRRADLYALGVVWFEVLTGRRPAGLELPSELRRGLPPRFDRAFRLCHTLDPERRVPTAAALRDAMAARPGERLVPAVAGAAVLLVLLALAAGSWRPGVPVGSRAPRASGAVPAAVSQVAWRAGTQRGTSAQVGGASGAVATRTRQGATLAGGRLPAGHPVLDAPALSPSWLECGARHEASQEIEEALVCYQVAQAIARTPAERGRARARTRLLRARRDEARLDLATAQRLAKEYRELRAGTSPGVPRYYAIARGAEAARLFRRSLGHRPDDAVRLEAQALEARLRAERRALEQDARDAEKRRHYQEAYAALALAAGLALDDAWSARALQAELGRLREAAEAERGDSRRAAAPFDARQQEAEALAASGDLEGAARAFQAAVDAGAGAEVRERLLQVRGQLWTRRGELALLRERLDDAAAAFRQALRFGDTEAARRGLRAVQNRRAAESELQGRQDSDKQARRRGHRAGRDDRGTEGVRVVRLPERRGWRVVDAAGWRRWRGVDDAPSRAPAQATGEDAPAQAAAPGDGSDRARTGVALVLTGQRGFLRVRPGGAPVYYVAGQLLALARVRQVVLSIRYLDREGSVIHARTRQVPRLERFSSYPFAEEVFDSALAQRIASYKVVVTYRARDRGRAVQRRASY